MISTKGMKRIGKGAFSSCYKKGNKKVLLVSIDPVKECMSNDFFPNVKLFPKIEHVGSIRDKQVYEMEFYPKNTSLKKSLKPKQYKLYRDLKSLFSNADRRMFESRYDMWYRIFDNSKLHHTHKQPLLDALDACANYGDSVCFEISPRNVAVKNGNLVLLDCFFLKSELNKIYKPKWI